MANLVMEEGKRETDEDNITKRLNKAFESRLDLDRVWKKMFIKFGMSDLISMEFVSGYFGGTE